MKLNLDPDFKEEEPDEYAAPDGCQIVTAIDAQGNYVFLNPPHLWTLEMEPHPPDSGFPQGFEEGPGLYLITWRYRESTDWESGLVDDWTFDPIDFKELSYE